MGIKTTNSHELRQNAGVVVSKISKLGSILVLFLHGQIRGQWPVYLYLLSIERYYN